MLYFAASFVLYYLNDNGYEMSLYINTLLIRPKLVPFIEVLVQLYCLGYLIGIVSETIIKRGTLEGRIQEDIQAYFVLAAVCYMEAKGDDSINGLLLCNRYPIQHAMDTKLCRGALCYIFISMIWIVNMRFFLVLHGVV